MHSDRCRIADRTINEWLDTRGQIPALLNALQRHGWIRRHQDPQNSRFWRLITGNRAPMFGVFSGYELQLLHDWIAGEWQCEQPGRTGSPHSPADNSNAAGLNDHLRREEACLQKTLNTLSEKQRSQHLLELMAPARHFTPAGLAATRIFGRQL